MGGCGRPVADGQLRTASCGRLVIFSCANRRTKKDRKILPDRFQPVGQHYRCAQTVQFSPRLRLTIIAGILTIY
jgi:hypothetical protein